MRVSMNALEQISIISSKRFDSNWKMFMTLFNFCFRFVRASSRKTSEWWRLLENILKANGEQKSSIMLYLNRSKTKFDIAYEWEQVLYFDFKIIIYFPISDVLWVGFIITAFSKAIRYLVWIVYACIIDCCIMSHPMRWHHHRRLMKFQRIEVLEISHGISLTQSRLTVHN